GLRRGGEAGRGRGCKEGDLRGDGPAGRWRGRHPDDFQRSRRSAEHERPCAGPARGTTGRRVAPHPPQRASGHAPGHRRQPVMKRIVGILLIVLILYALILSSRREARTLGTHQKLAQRLALFGVLTVGAGTLIIAGGIDLSIGSVFCLAGVALGLLLNGRPEGTSATFLVLTIVTASGCVAAVAYPPLRDRYGRLL